MSKTPPPLRKFQSEPDDPKSKSTLSKLADGIKQRVSEVQTRPDFSRFKLGEIQTIPDWMKRKSKATPPTQDDNNAEWVRIIPFAGQKYNSDKLPSKLASISGIVHFRFYKDDKSQIHIYASHQDINGLRKALRQRVPDADFQESQAPPSFSEKYINRVGGLGGTLNEKGDLAAILDALEDETYIDIAFEGRAEHEFKKPLRDYLNGRSPNSGRKSASEMTVGGAWKELIGVSPSKKPSKTKSDEKTAKHEMTTEEKEQAKRVSALISESSNYFRVTIKIGAARQNLMGAIFNEINSQMKKQHQFSMSTEEKTKLWSSKGDTEPLWREEELAVLIALPDMTNERMLQAITHLRPGERTLDDNELTKGVAIGRLIHPTKPNRLIMVPTPQFLKHGFLTGKTGAGKTSTAIQAIQSIIDEWGANPGTAPGFTYIDPNRSALITIVNRLLHMEQHLGIKIPWEKVHYLDMRPESQYPVGLNLLHCSPDADITEVSQNIVDMIMSTYGSSGTLGKTEKLMDNGLATLLSDRSRVHTIFGLNYVYMYPLFRETLTIRDPMLKMFWRTDGADTATSELTAMNNRLRPLLNATAMRRIFGQTTWTLQIRKWMDEGHIVLVDALGLGDMGVKVAMGQLVTQYHITANQRPADISKPHILMIDEAHLVQIPILSRVIAVDRKFGLSLVLITQSPEQFNADLRTAITENMGTFMVCKVGPKSASAMAEMMNSAFDKNTLQALPSNDVAVLTEINKQPFSFKVRSDPPIMYLPNGDVAKYDQNVGGETWQAQEWALAKAMELASREGRHVEDVDRDFEEYDEWWEQFAPEDEDGHDEPRSSAKSKGKAKNYRPTEDEQPILDAVIGLVEDKGGSWQGYAKELLAELSDYLDQETADDLSASQLGSLLTRANDWLVNQGVEAEKKQKEKGAYWFLDRSRN